MDSGREIEYQGDRQQLTPENQKDGEKRMFVPSLAVSGFAVSISAPMLSLLTLDIASTFNVSVGVAAQLSTVNNLFEIIFALAMGALAVRFRHKSLLLIGTLLVVVSAIIGFFAPTLALMQISFALEGGGTVMVSIMSLALIGEFLPTQKKAKAVSYVFAIVSMASLVGTPLIGFFTDMAGWRSVFLLLVLPISAIGLVMSFLSLPTRPAKEKDSDVNGGYKKSFKQVFLSKSATGCLIGGIVSAAGTSSFGIFAIAFYRVRFLASRDFTVAVMFMVLALFVLAALGVGRVVNRVGAKNLAAFSIPITGILTLSFFFAPYLWVALILNVFHAFSFAASGTAFNCLVIDQVPKSRGTMLSLKTVCGSLGAAIGAGLAGTLLVLFSYQAVGIALGAMCVTTGVVYYFLIKDPAKK
jgi:predicted MFS family arabinose efflux permease